MAISLASLARLALFAAALPLPAAVKRRRSNDEGQCVPLKNEGAYFGVDVSVGVPPQKFTLVADTGSNNLIVVSCACTEAGGCTGSPHCFRGTNKSSSFKLDSEPMALAITFGSGTVQTVLATENASVGDFSAYMPDDLLLLIDDAHLDVQGHFEGILGLGIPGAGDQAAGGGEDNSQRFPRSFLEDAGVTSFEMCFKSGGDGALRLNHTLVDPVKSVGTAHWGVGLSGITVGGDGTAGAGTALVACSAADKQAGYETPCGLIPDSGTTLILGPKQQIYELYAALCTQWPMCSSQHKAMMQEAAASQVLEGHGDEEVAAASQIVKTKLFMYLLVACDEWMKKPEDFDALPSLHLNITDRGNTTRQLELTAWSYILEGNVGKQEQPDVDGLPPALVSLLQAKVRPLLDSDAEKVGGKRVCQPAFDVMEYGTKANGQVWIFGTPLFYQYQVGYDLAKKSLAFTKLGSDGVECGSCSVGSNTQKSFLTYNGRHGQKQLRRMTGTPRMPYIDTTKPL